MGKFYFDLQRFVAIVISAGESYTLDGITYTAVDGAVQMTLDGEGKISGISSGKVQASASGTENVSLTLDATDGAANFALTLDEGNFTFQKTVAMKLNGGAFTLTSDRLNAAAGSSLAIFSATDDVSFKDAVYFDSAGAYIFSDDALTLTGEQITETFSVTKDGVTNSLTGRHSGTIINNYAQGGFTLTKDSSLETTLGGYTFQATAQDDASGNIQYSASGFTFIPNLGNGGLNIFLKKDGTPIFAGNLNITDGTVFFNTDEQKVSFTEGTKISLGIGTDGSQAMNFEIVGGTAVFKVEADSSGNFTITPDENDGFLAIALNQNGTTIFQDNVTVNGSMIFNPATELFTLKDGTSVSFSFDNYTLNATANGDATSKISLTADGMSITPQAGDGTLDFTMMSSNGSISAGIEILSGGFLFGTNGALNVYEGTELQFKFSEDYIVNLKATNSAGGAISIGADGITFAPNSGDGELQLSVTRNGETRTATLDVTGSLTYKLDGSISLAEGTVVKNVFEDGNILTITANTDAAGSIFFYPTFGLRITPASSDSLTLKLIVNNN